MVPPLASNRRLVILRRNRKAIFLFLSYLLAGCASPRSPFSYFHPEVNFGEGASLRAKVSEIEKQDFENIHFETLAQNQLSSHHLVVIRGGEPLHDHARHDAWALVLKGEGDFLLGERKLALRSGSSVFIPRGIPHRATRQGRETLAAFVIFTPPYDGVDPLPHEKVS